MMYHLLEILHGPLLHQPINHCTEPLQSMGSKSVITLEIPDCILPIGSSLKNNFFHQKKFTFPIANFQVSSHPIAVGGGYGQQQHKPRFQGRHTTRPSRNPRRHPSVPVTRDSVLCTFA
uniref:(northern house mosquito) hypothetical protein n=1 Tax=Culex pipiens TaxID=7175 RepID=A0A8D8A807_CULPI